MTEQIQSLLRCLEKNNIRGFFCPNRQEALIQIISLLPDGASVCAGGSATLREIGLLDRLEDGPRHYQGHTHTASGQLSCNTAPFTCDTFLTGINAITENGELYNVDGSANRIAPLLYGSRQVIAVAGVNKIVPTLDDAVLRVKTIVAPMNARAKGRDLYCAKVGQCCSSLHDNPLMTDGCDSPQRICNAYSVIARQHPLQKDRIKVILIGETLGF